jgi:hypothetical protein
MALITSEGTQPERIRIMATKSTKDDPSSTAEPTPQPVSTDASTTTNTTNIEGDVNIDIDWANWFDRGPRDDA